MSGESAIIVPKREHRSPKETLMRSPQQHLVVGAGPVGRATASLLADAGHVVQLVSRRGLGPEHPAIERVRADATDAGALRDLAVGSAAIYNCLNPPYTSWEQDWPPMAHALLEAAEASGAVLATTGNLYGYGPMGFVDDAPMTEQTPLETTGTKGRVRVQMWREALAAHEAGRVRVTEVRGSDYLGAGLADTSHLGRLAPKILAGKKVRVLGSADMPHTWTYVPDVARTLVTVAADERAWGRAWHVPSAPACTQRELITRFAEIGGAPAARVGEIPEFAFKAIAKVVPLMRELQEMYPSFTHPYILDSSATTRTFGIDATPLDDSLRVIAQYWQLQLAHPHAA
jgi:nucleoside-diphosphate-sugar epimerase